MPDIFLEQQAHPKTPQPDSRPTSHPQPKPMFPLAAFADHPDGIFFATQAPGETIEIFLRKHFITNVPWIVSAIILFLLPPILIPFFAPFFPFVVSGNLGLILILFWYLAVFGVIVFTSFINWYFNVYIVTTERVLDVDFVNLLYREVSATRLNLVQDVTVKAAGVIRSIFNYGDVFIQTAGTEVNFDFMAVPNPEGVQERIEELMRGARQKEGQSDLEDAMES